MALKTIITLHPAFVAMLLLFFLMVTLPPTSHAYSVSKNAAMTVGRRAFLAHGIAFTSAALTITSGGDAAVAAAAVVDGREKNNEKASRESKEEQERKKAEKEARRIAEETKKRLAVGRIGTI